MGEHIGFVFSTIYGGNIVQFVSIEADYFPLENNELH